MLRYEARSVTKLTLYRPIALGQENAAAHLPPAEEHHEDDIHLLWNTMETTRARLDARIDGLQGQVEALTHAVATMTTMLADVSSAGSAHASADGKARARSEAPSGTAPEPEAKPTWRSRASLCKEPPAGNGAPTDAPAPAPAPASADEDYTEAEPPSWQRPESAYLLAVILMASPRPEHRLVDMFCGTLFLICFTIVQAILAFAYFDASWLESYLLNFPMYASGGGWLSVANFCTVRRHSNISPRYQP